MLPLPPTPPSMATLPDWCRKVVGLVNGLLAKRQFPESATAPTDPRPGDGWFDTSVNKAKIWDGSSWNALW